MKKFDSLKYPPIVITIDGTAASGKGTILKGLLKRLDDRYKTLDAGLMYRALTYFYLEDRGKFPKDLESEENLESRLREEINLDISVNGEIYLNSRKIDEGKLRTKTIGEYVSKYSALSPIKSYIVELQRDFVRENRGEYGLILDGRCMGSAVVPDAEVKIFTDAPIWVRAAWRQRELYKKGEDCSVLQIKNSLAKRDEEDYSTQIAPLIKPEDAYDLDTSHFSPNQAVEYVFDIVKKQLIALGEYKK